MNKKIKFGKKDLVGGKVAPHEIKVKITINLDGDVLSHYRKTADGKGIGYQTFIQQVLREQMGAPSLEERLAALERAVLKKKAG